MTKPKSSISMSIVHVYFSLIYLIALVLVIEWLPMSHAATESSSATKLGAGPPPPPNRNFIHIQPEQQQHQPSGRSTSSNNHHHHQHHQRQQKQQQQQHTEPDEAAASAKQRNVIVAGSASSSQQQYSLTDESITNHNSNNPSGLPDDAFYNSEQQQQQPNQHIFINQSNNIYIVAKHGQVVYLPCVVFKQKHFDLSNVHVIWHRLYERSRPVVLSIGMQQLKQDMRYRVKVQNLSKSRAFTEGSLDTDEPLAFSSSSSSFSDDTDRGGMVKREDLNGTATPTAASTTTTTVDPRDEYLIQNWQFEIRKLTFDDAGTYQCLLPLVKPISKNITLQVIPDLSIEPRESSNFKVNDKIVLKCRATMRSLHKTPSLHLIHQRQSKSSILWYKENDIIKSSALQTNDGKSSDELNAEHEGVGMSGDGAKDPTDGDQKQLQQQHKHTIEIETKLDTNEQTLNSILTINHAREDDSGKYRCIYDNIQENVQIKVINDHYEYKKYLASINSASSSTSPLRRTTTLATHVLCFFLFISTTATFRWVNLL